MPDITCTPLDDLTVHYPDGIRPPGLSYGKAATYHKHFRDGAKGNPWHPFLNSFDFNAGRQLIESHQTKGFIDRWLNSGMDNDKIKSFHNAEQLWTLFEMCDHGLRDCPWHRLSLGPPEEESTDKNTVFFRDVLRCAQFLLQYLPFQDHMGYAPVQQHTEGSMRVFNQMWTGDWWWKQQIEIADGGTIVPLLFASDKTHLTNFSGDKFAWPLYMSIGNISKAIRSERTKKAWVLVALLPIPRKGPDPGEIHDLCHRALDAILHHIKGVTEDGARWACSDGGVRHCYPVICAWLADYQEHACIARLVDKRCPRCELPPEEMGHDVNMHGGVKRDKDTYLEMLERNKTPADFKVLGVTGARPVFWDHPRCDVYSLW